jgi:hypothetical protein
MPYFRIDKRKAAFRREELVCEMVNPHYCDIIGRNKHPLKNQQPKDWEFIRCKARDRAMFPHSEYDLVFACGQTDPRGITVITNYGDAIGKPISDEFFISQGIRQGQCHKHSGTGKNVINSAEAFERASGKRKDS